MSSTFSLLLGDCIQAVYGMAWGHEAEAWSSQMSVVDLNCMLSRATLIALQGGKKNHLEVTYNLPVKLALHRAPSQFTFPPPRGQMAQGDLGLI